jgi:death-on-curing protein
MSEPEWVSNDVAIAIHSAQLHEHGGLPGFRDRGAFESAMARPQNLFAYSDPKPSLTALGASYAVGIATNHGFVDGNKRTGWVVCALFLELNGCDINVDENEVVSMMEGVADHARISEEEFVEWLDNYIEGAASGSGL